MKRLLCFLVDDEDTDMPVIAQINVAYSNSEEVDLRERIMELRDAGEPWRTTGTVYRDEVLRELGL